jgi:hypothetical protein
LEKDPLSILFTDFFTRFTLLAALMSGAAAVAPAADILGVDLNGTYVVGDVCGNRNNCSLGYGFTVNQAITIDALGLWDQADAAFVEDHPVGLWDGTGTLIASATVTNSSTAVASAETGSQWMFTSITPVTLSAGQYFIAGLYSEQSKDAVAVEATAVTAPGITLGDAMLGLSSSLVEPTTAESAFDQGFFGPGFQVEGTPEPASLGLLLAGLAGIAMRARRKR